MFWSFIPELEVRRHHWRVFFFSPHAYFKIGFHAALKAVDPTGLMVLFFFDVFVSPYVENSASFGGI